MMAHLRTTILATPEQVLELKQTLNSNQNWNLNLSIVSDFESRFRIQQISELGQT
jgi:hypothetical protein